ncbi:MAG TPA: YceI family protein [Povalibacter sp.]|uniref:YceI family protein n=1 Tax=Povalibacter sp. TaxID=1962978 RepID=UPI002B885668|nr:YceI family protein [Povalibacter sp.]HMN45469.1 YceI family protein [Povalibacter sp.]
MSTRMITRALLLLASAGLLTACPKPVRPPERAPAAPTAPAEVRDATVYDVDPETSTLHVLVYRGGALARLGHNHVMSVRGLQGRLWVHAMTTKSGFDVSFPVARMIVDDPEARRAAGSDFPPDVPEADRDGTRRNMLRAEVLDAGRYPTISLKSVNIAGSAANAQVTAQVTIRDVSREVSLQPAISIEADRVTVRGKLDLLQSDFGIKPFSAALGALTVQDRLHVTFEVVAVRRRDP